MSTQQPPMPPESPYYQPGVIRYVSDLIEETARDGLRLAERLESGDMSALPGAVSDWMTLQTSAANNAGLGVLRTRIAEVLDQPPYTETIAQRIGALVRGCVQFANTSRAEFELTEVENQFTIGNMFGGQPED